MKDARMSSKWFFVLMMLAIGGMSTQCGAHCQMPCGIYHDDMVFDQVDQYVETMYKAISMLKDSQFSTVREKNEFIRWVIQKEKASDEVAQLITTYFLQQKIKPGEEDTVKKLVSAHKLLFLAVQIKQNTDLSIVEAFSDEWDLFKHMFHIEGYECEIEKIKLKKREMEKKALGEKQKLSGKSDQEHLQNEHSHPHEHDHVHTDHPHPHDHDHAQ
jgi:nickel superoxide dismutase